MRLQERTLILKIANLLVNISMREFSVVNWALQKNLFATFILLSAAIFAFGQNNQRSPQTMEVSDDGVPVLIKHLPDWENAQKRSAIVVNLQDLQKLSGNRPILNEVEFIGGTEAATATYDKARLIIIEFPTPQMAIDTDAKIQAKLSQSPQPNTAYRKTGNYVVFVFDASDEQTANSLLDGVSYEKDVQWLGDNPYPAIAAARKEREFVLATGDIILTVIKTSGLAILAALGIGGIFGTLLFYRRRQQQAAADAYSDAGGMLRLNLDEMTPQTDASRLLEK